MSGPLPTGPQILHGLAEAQKRDQAIAVERRRWWELRECYARCVQIAKDEWEHVLDLAEQQQHDTALEMRDRVAKGVRATGKEYDADRSIPVPLLTPRDKVQFVKEAAVTLFIEACKKSLPVTPEGKRAAQKTDGPDTVEAGSAADETDGDREAQDLAEAGSPPEGAESPEGVPASA